MLDESLEGMLMKWRKWKEKRPTDISLLYWWRMNPVYSGGVLWHPAIALKLQEWFNDGKTELWPVLVRWDGWTYSLPEEIEWAVAGKCRENDVLFNFAMPQCPYCKETLMLELSYSRFAGNSIPAPIGARHPKTATAFTAKCPKCRCVSTPRVETVGEIFSLLRMSR